jgi:hypothetical protein
VSGLKKRFEAFVRTLPGFESIDDLLHGRDPPGKKRADYLFLNRSVIVEQKVLEVDPKEKPQQFVDGLMQEGRFIAYGRHSTASLFAQLPDGERLNQQLFDKLTHGVEDAVRQADKQTRDTKEIFAIPNATGVLVYLNDQAGTLNPELVLHKIGQMWLRRKHGQLRYPHNVLAIVISEAHRVKDPRFTRLMPILWGSPPHGTTNVAAGEFARMLINAWALFNNAPLIHSSGGTIPTSRSAANPRGPQ